MGMGPSKACIFEASKHMFLLFVPLLIGTGLSGAWILKYEIQIYHLDQSFSYDTDAFGHGAKWSFEHLKTVWSSK